MVTWPWKITYMKKKCFMTKCSTYHIDEKCQYNRESGASCCGKNNIDKENVSNWMYYMEPCIVNTHTHTQCPLHFPHQSCPNSEGKTFLQTFLCSSTSFQTKEHRDHSVDVSSAPQPQTDTQRTVTNYHLIGFLETDWIKVFTSHSRQMVISFFPANLMVQYSKKTKPITTKANNTKTKII